MFYYNIWIVDIGFCTVFFLKICYRKKLSNYSPFSYVTLIILLIFKFTWSKIQFLAYSCMSLSTYINHHNQDRGQFSKPQIFLCYIFEFNCYSIPIHFLTASDLFSIHVFLFSPEFHIHGVIQYITFWDWFLSST
jgi:hypothetical protein